MGGLARARPFFVSRRSPRSRPRTTPASSSDASWTAFAVAILLASTAFAYATSFAGVFVFDDEPAIVENPHIRTLWPPAAAMSAPVGTTLSGRPAAALTFAANYALAPTEARDAFRLAPSASTVQVERFLQNVWGYHAANLLIHLGAALALFGVVRRTLQMFPPGRGVRERASVLALSCAVLWAVHPLTTSAVTYIVQRVESLMALCVLLTLYCSIRAWSGSRWWIAAAVSACAAGMASKESMVAAPLLVVIWDAVFSAVQPWRELLHRRRLLYAGLASTWILLAVLVAGAHRPDAAGFGFAEWPWWRYLMTQSGVITHYLRLVVWPSPLVFDYDWRPSTLLASLLPSLLIGVLLFLGAVALYRRRPLGFAIAAFFLLLAPTSSVLPVVTEVAAEHRMYLPLALAIAVLRHRRVYLPAESACVTDSSDWWRRSHRGCLRHGDVRQEPRLSQRRGAVAGHGEQAPGECPRATQLRDDPSRERAYWRGRTAVARSDSPAFELCRSARGAGSGSLRATAICRRTRASEYRADHRARLCRRASKPWRGLCVTGADVGRRLRRTSVRWRYAQTT